MNCKICQENLSQYIDGELDAKQASEIKVHLSICADCAKINEDFVQLLGFCNQDNFQEVEPPNSQAMWCRINNIIENEVKPEISKEAQIKEQNRGLIDRIWSSSWSFSFAQVSSAVLGIAVISCLLTIVAVKNFSSSDESNEVHQSLFERSLVKVGLLDSVKDTREKRLKQQQTTIDYWNLRVQQRRQQWNAHLREAFDRNLREIDQVVFEYTQILEENPNDEVSGEMLDTALNDKVELLREFSEL
jgi:anti-sigma factor RsiW